MKNTWVSTLRWVAIGEGISYLAIFLISMPLKYLADIHWPNYVVGMAHGILFILYGVLTLLVARQLRWSIGRTLMALIASLLPFATFVVEKKWLREETEEEAA